MADELIDIYDEDNNPLNGPKMKSEAHRIGLWHRSAHIWMYNSKGDILLQLRAKDKEQFPNKWDISVAGHVDAGEEPIVSALREISEEIGLDVKEDDLEFYKIGKTDDAFDDVINREHSYIYLMRFDGDPDSLRLQEEEVSGLKFLTLEQIEEEVKTNPDLYVPHGDYWSEIVSEVRKRLK